MSDTSSTVEVSIEPSVIQTKRKSTDAGLPANGPRKLKSVKRRASKACQCCRARKVRCNVVEQVPCTNCRLDEVECIVSESKRKKKWGKDGDESMQDLSFQESGPLDPQLAGFGRDFSQTPTGSIKPFQHIPHNLYQDLHYSMPEPGSRRHTFSTAMPITHALDTANVHASSNGAFFIPHTLSPTPPAHRLPAFIKPLPQKIGSDEIAYLSKKGALTIPAPPLRNALLRSFVEYVYPFMPLLDVHDLLESIDRNDGKNAVSLLMFQAVMFSAVASVGIRYLKAAGYSTRRDARRDFFQRLRLLYDFDYEMDRISLIQSLLLMTYWYETPDDQKDSHHWMGIAVSLSHTIGLHRNPERSTMDAKRQKLWKRIWWSTYMRDRLIALGMRRPTRIKNEDFDVPMLTIDDFEIAALPAGSSRIPSDCTLIQDAAKQHELAIMCIEKAKLCICISHVLSTQYSVLHNNHGVQSKEGSTRTTMMLVARKEDPDAYSVWTCDEELQRWKDTLAPEAEYVDPSASRRRSGDECVILNKSLLHMVYYATLSALHRPQVLPSSAWPPRDTATELLEVSRRNVRQAANEITTIAETLSRLNLVKYLPTVGITVLLPAIIIHLLDIKAPDEFTRRASLQGFCQCMQIMSKLRDIYAAADYSTAFLEAAIRKAEITLPQSQSQSQKLELKDNFVTTAASLVDVGKTLHLVPDTNGNEDDRQLTPPPDEHHGHGHGHSHSHSHSHGQNMHNMTNSRPHAAPEDDLAKRINHFLASTPPDSDEHGESSSSSHLGGATMAGAGSMSMGGEGVGLMMGSSAEPMTLDELADFEPDFDALINLDAAGESFALDDASFAQMPDGNGAGFAFDVNWMRGGKEDAAAL